MVGLLVVSTASGQVLVRQPADVADARSISYVNKNPPRGSPGVTLWGSHYQLQPTEDQTLGSDTGFSPPIPRDMYQLSVDPDSAGATAVQAYGGEIGINIHSASIAANLPERFNLGTIVLGANLVKPARPFVEGRKAKYSFTAKIPRSRQTNRGVSQVVAYYNLRDLRRKQGFWFGMVVFDSRGWSYQRSDGLERAMWDKGTNQPIVHATAGHSNTLLDRGHPTTAFGGQPFPDSRSYAFVIGAPQVRAAVALLKSRYPELATKYSDDPAEYAIGHINLNPEVYVPAGSFAQIGMSVVDWQLEILP
ncbi:MAG: hypothetical protein KIS73_23620 [Enhydrobacter sp.]|nr:hypothetical protein [Enhydrobacter sp.]